MIPRSAYKEAREELFTGLCMVLRDLVQDEADGKDDVDVVLLTGQRLQGLIVEVEHKLKGIE